LWHERLGPKFERFKIGEFYYLPWSNPWVRENVHGVPSGVSIENARTRMGVPSRLSAKKTVGWHPHDTVYVPLRTPEGKTLGILCMDDPVDGRMPTRESLVPLELFVHQAAMIIENAQLIENLRQARGQLEQKVDERTRELRISQEQLLRAQRLAVIGELAGMVGHDLRNPLTSIAGATYYIKKRPNSQTDSKICEMLELVEKNIAYSNKIINDLLDYSKEIKLDLVETTPKSIMTEALRLVRIPKSIRLVNMVESKPRMKTDVEKIKRCFVNIIKNAVEAMPDGGKLMIKCERLNGSVEFMLSDTGTGMSKETIAKLWTPLFTTKAKGMGFGLAICKRVVEAHGGLIRATSTRGKRSTFTVTLPVEAKTTDGGEELWVKTPKSSLLTTTKT
jgi:signal transduction histidine kinase